MTDPKKTEALFLAAEQEEARTKYEALLNTLLDEVHALVEHSEQPWAVDDSKVHELIQHLRDNYGPEVTS